MPVLERFFGREPAVAFAVLEHPLDGLPGVLGDQLGHQLAHARVNCSAWIAMSTA